MYNPILIAATAIKSEDEYENDRRGMILGPRAALHRYRRTAVDSKRLKIRPFFGLLWPRASLARQNHVSA